MDKDCRNKNINLIIIGEGEDRKKIELKIKKLNIEKNIKDLSSKQKSVLLEIEKYISNQTRLKRFKK